MDVYISYSREDRKLAQSLYQALTDNGVSAWLDLEALTPGSDWLEIERAVRSAKNLVMLVSTREPSPSQQLEWRVALEATWAEPTKRLIPVLLRKAELPHFLHSLTEGEKAIAAIRVDDPRRDWDRALSKIIAVVKETSSLADAADILVKITEQDRVRQRERIDYLKDAAKSFRESENDEAMASKLSKD